MNILTNNFFIKKLSNIDNEKGNIIKIINDNDENFDKFGELYISEIYKQIFQKNSKHSHFMGGKIVKSKEIFLNGQIRSGRSALIKKRLINELKKSLLNNLKINKDSIWIYLEDLLPEQMIEYGETLPKSGGERKWFNSLPSGLRKRLKKIDN